MPYDKQGFAEGMTLTHTHLENMEDGIIESLKGIDNLENVISDIASDEVAVIPSYWVSHVDEKIVEINAIAEELGNKADSFIFITDMHYPSHTKDHAPELIKYVIENTSIKKVFIGGDTINGSQTNKKDIALLRSLKKRFKGIQIFPVRGNHEYWSSGVTEEQFWASFANECEQYCKCSSGLMDYYYDDNTRKIRYIFTDSVYGDYSSETTSEEQQNWIKDRIKELDASWTVLIIKHHLWNWSTLGTLNEEGVIIKNLVDSIYDDAKCTIAGVYGGHSHKDYHVQADKGYLMVTTASDSYMIRDNASCSGTNEQTFDVVFFNPSTREIKTIRIGQGENREFTY